MSTGKDRNPCMIDLGLGSISAQVVSLLPCFLFPLGEMYLSCSGHAKFTYCHQRVAVISLKQTTRGTSTTKICEDPTSGKTASIINGSASGTDQVIVFQVRTDRII